LYQVYLFAKHLNTDEETEYKTILGNQPYDAVMIKDGQEKKIEVSMYHDGNRSYKEAVSLNTVGYSDPIIHGVDEHMSQYIDSFAQCVRNKQGKNYDDTIILFAVDINEVFSIVYEYNYKEFVKKLTQTINSIFQTGNDIYLVIPEIPEVANELVIKIR
jgi:hypothetical protein